MAKIILKKAGGSFQHTLYITALPVADPGLPEDVFSYFTERLKSSKKGIDKGKELVTCFRLGETVSMLVADLKTDISVLKEKFRRNAAQVCDLVNGREGGEVAVINLTRVNELSLVAAEGLSLANYQFFRHKSGSAGKNSLQRVIVVHSGIRAAEIDCLNAVCEATRMARDLVNEPVNKLNAEGLAAAFSKMGKEAGFKVTVFNKARISSLKMGGLLAVNAGSVDEPTFTVMEYKPAGAKNRKPYVLVGKGVVYDTGGLSLKPTPNSMDSMKCDMAGGAAVGAALYAIAKSKLPVHVIALVPATDNRPGFNAFAPGDIITMMDGSTVEMLNSDAEGRMILADALHYAKRFNPQLTIDIATLTGAAAAAIGPFGIVGMGTASGRNRELLVESGFTVHERIAEFPFWDEYDELLKSDISDRKNIGGPQAGAITAGKFLAKYADYPYYHLDIAGPAFLGTRDSYRGKGGTGVGVRLFFEFFRRVANE